MTTTKRLPLAGHRRDALSATAALMLACGALASIAGPVFARPQADSAAAAPAAPSAPSNAQLLDDYAHYVQTANYTMAESVGAQLLARTPEAKDFAALVEAGDLRRFEAATQRALRVRDRSALQDITGALLKKYETGRLDRARDPQQISANIKDLTGTLRARLLARQGLVQAGEYAVPQLLEALLQSNDAELSVQAQSVLVDLGRQAIVPLATAMFASPELAQERIVRVLGAIPYRQSLPYLADLAASTQNASVRSAAQQAIERLGGSGSADVAGLYRGLAEAYYASAEEVTSFPTEDFQLLWSASPQAGLAMNAIRTSVFHEAMAMRLAERAMQLQTASGGTADPETLALWVASNYSREFDTPAGYRNPAYLTAEHATQGETARRSAEYFGIASGANVTQRVLARAIDTRNTRLARRAIAAIEQTAGGKAALDVGGQRTPLSSALVYPDRRVQVESALAIAMARPTQAFAGSERVVPTLADAVSGLAQQTAVVLSLNSERYQSVRALLEKQGFTVLPQGASLSDVQSAIDQAPAINLVVVVGFTAERTAQLIGETKGMPQTSTAGVLALVAQDIYAQQQTALERTAGVAVRPVGTGEGPLASTISDLLDKTAGGAITKDEAAAYTARALTALRELALSNNPALDPSGATSALIGKLKAEDATHRTTAAGVLAMVGNANAQRALMDAAIAATGADRNAMLAQVADSAKRFGNQLEARQTDELLRMAGASDEASATAAAAAMGALGISNEQLMPLILPATK